MRDKIIKVSCTLLGLSSLIYCIIDEVDGIGRFALIIFGIIFVLLGSFKNLEK